ncbi:MAG: HAD hydrolase family protein [Desulfamplus sp.]|nr:HAD hydrolase family protein [Desulfamplus sp.]
MLNKIKQIYKDKERYKAIVCDLDGTLLHGIRAKIAVPGRTRSSFLCKDAALLLKKIGQILPIVIATGRNANSVYKLIRELPDVRFSGFVLENGFVVKNSVDDRATYKPNLQNHQKNQVDWDKIAALFPDWERLPFYENCAGFVFNFNTNEINSMSINEKAKYAQKILKQNGYNYPVYKEKRKVFIYLGNVDKTKGLALLGVNSYIAIGDGENDIELLHKSSCPITLKSGCFKLQKIVEQKNGFCSIKQGHQAAVEMLECAYNLVR